jgi:hypothetical protein
MNIGDVVRIGERDTDARVEALRAAGAHSTIACARTREGAGAREPCALTRKG